MLSQDFPRKVALLSSVKKKKLVEMVMDADIIFFGAGAFGTALGIKAYLEQNDVSGKWSFTDAREKKVVPQKHLWLVMVFEKTGCKDFTRHPEDVNEVATRLFKFL